MTAVDARVSGTFLNAGLEADAPAGPGIGLPKPAFYATTDTHTILRTDDYGATWYPWLIGGGGTAADIVFVPVGTIAATDVQAAIAELDSELPARISAGLSSLVAGAPAALDTLDELAAALGDDANFASTVTTALAGKVSASLVDAKGDLLVGSANDTVARMAVGADTYVLTADATAPLGIKWAPSTGGGGGTVAPASLGKSTLLRKSGNQTLATGAWESVTWDTEDTDSLSGHSTTTNTSRFVAPVAGVYFIQAQIATDSGLYTKLLKNGTSVISPQTSNRGAGVGNVGFSQGVAYLAAGDYVELQSYKGSSHTVYANNGGELPSLFSATLLYDASGAGAIGAPAQRVLLAPEVVLSAASATFDFTGIQQTYRDLEIVVEGRTSSGTKRAANVYFNNDTTAGNYKRGFVYWNTASGVGIISDPSVFEVSGTGSQKSVNRLRIPSYTDGFSKTFEVSTQEGDNTGIMIAGTWSGTAAVNRITVTLAGGDTFVAGSKARIYGYADVTEAQAGTVTADASWHNVGGAGEPAFQNSWANYGSGYAAAAFRKDANGFVHVKGVVSGGANNTVIFTLPAGYRPGGHENFAVTSSGQFGQVRVNQDGTLFVAVRPSATIEMSLMFFAEQ